MAEITCQNCFRRIVVDGRRSVSLADNPATVGWRRIPGTKDYACSDACRSAVEAAAKRNLENVP